MTPLPFDDAHAPLFTIGQVADMLNVQQAFLRRLDDQDVVTPARSGGGQRRYSRHQVEQVQEVQELVGEGLTLAGVRRVFSLQSRIAELEDELAGRRRDDGRPPAREREQPPPAMS
ncbi:MerR family transcriptional regulator [Motilibacter aurantiacus]|uniref:MerR family transcriptional regulator n=1 Tax=Motilibacter aurantiacus TaxID=2714955 RepID=UPI001407CCB3|nr:MerR family transcriptional regulator [Motilibacter aurantiacus]NHC47191.1 MerR family transcriptional regulator [Motilibacter aurantiacus]